MKYVIINDCWRRHDTDINSAPRTAVTSEHTSRHVTITTQGRMADMTVTSDSNRHDTITTQDKQQNRCHIDKSIDNRWDTRHD